MASTPEILQFPKRAIRKTSQLRRGMTSAVSPRASTGRLAAISHGKLRQESSSQAPNLRRCLAHQGILQQCVRAAQEQTDQHLKKFGGDAATANEPGTGIQTVPSASKSSPIRSQIIKAVKAMAQNRYTSAPRQRQPPLPRPASEVSEKASLTIRTRQHASRIFPVRPERTNPPVAG